MGITVINRAVIALHVPTYVFTPDLLAQSLNPGAEKFKHFVARMFHMHRGRYFGNPGASGSRPACAGPERKRKLRRRYS
jgi:hypothetical protein